MEFTAVTNVAVVGDRIDDGRGHKDLSSAGGGTDTGSFVDSLAQVVIAKVDSFGGVELRQPEPALKLMATKADSVTPWETT